MAVMVTGVTCAVLCCGLQLVDPNGTNGDGAQTPFRVHDDADDMKRVCTKIASRPGRVVIEAELKKVLGFRMAAGHRAWRKVKVGMGRGAGRAASGWGPVCMVRVAG